MGHAWNIHGTHAWACMWHAYEHTCTHVYGPHMGQTGGTRKTCMGHAWAHAHGRARGKHGECMDRAASAHIVPVDRALEVPQRDVA
eukprot:51331-Chlamydomonas_euryale.AAC.1